MPRQHDSRPHKRAAPTHSATTAQAVMEPLFEIPYLAGIVALGVFTLRLPGGKRHLKLFGITAVALSFVFYTPVVLWADRLPAPGMLMIPKTGA